MNYYNSIDINLYNKQVSIIITRFKNRLLEDIEFNALFSNKNYEKEVNDLALNIKNIITIVEEKTNYNITYLSDELDTTLNLVLTHNPDDIDLLSSDEEYVVLAGGSLKGQVRIPFFGGIIKKDGYKKYTESYYNIGNIKLYNSGGIGTNNVNFRLFNKPEINLYRLEKK